jgi:cell division protein FtsA
MVLHAQPTLYTLDDVRGVKKPLGLHADKLGVDIHVIAADSSPVRNLDLSVRSAHLAVKSIVAAPIATGLACLSDEERELGVALVELGAGVTNVSLFAGGMLVGLAAIPYGGSDITDDIASAFGTRRSQAERIKCFYGSATTSPRDNHDMIDVAPMAGGEEGTEPQRITRAQLISVIRQRLDLLSGDIAAALKQLGFAGPVGRQVVLTGGGAELKGIADYIQGVLGRAVRIGRPRGLAGLPEAHAGPAFATLSGLALYAASNPVDLRGADPARLTPERVTPTGLVNRLIAAFRSGY